MQERQIVVRGMTLTALSQNKSRPPEFSPCYRVSETICTDLLGSAPEFEALHQELLYDDISHVRQMELLSASFILEALEKLNPCSKTVCLEYQRFHA